MKVKGENLLITATWFSLVCFSKGKSWKVHHSEWCTPESQPSPGTLFEQGFTWEEGEKKGKGMWCFPLLPVPLILSPANLETSVSVVSRGPFTSTATSLRGKECWLPTSSFSLIGRSHVWHEVFAAPALGRSSLTLQYLWWHRHLQLPWRSNSMVVFFSRGTHTDLVIETFTVTCLIIFCTEILSHNVACFSSSKPLRLCCASKWDQRLNLSLLLMQTHNYGQSAEQEVRLPSLSSLGWHEGSSCDECAIRVSALKRTCEKHLVAALTQPSALLSS